MSVLVHAYVLGLMKSVLYGPKIIGQTARSGLQDGRQRNSHPRYRYFRDRVCDVTKITK